ncbi:hypothetical protein A2U01_0078214, partial [Trifolium medium]|nr:hypothetical protein [Trifolium medium]
AKPICFRENTNRANERGEDQAVKDITKITRSSSPTVNLVGRNCKMIPGRVGSKGPLLYRQWNSMGRCNIYSIRTTI